MICHSAGTRWADRSSRPVASNSLYSPHVVFPVPLHSFMYLQLQNNYSDTMDIPPREKKRLHTTLATTSWTPCLCILGHKLLVELFNLADVFLNTWQNSNIDQHEPGLGVIPATYPDTARSRAHDTSRPPVQTQTRRPRRFPSHLPRQNAISLQSASPRPSRPDEIANSPSISSAYMTSAGLPNSLARRIAFSGISICGKRYIAPSAGWHDMPGRALKRSLINAERSLRFWCVRDVSSCQSS